MEWASVSAREGLQRLKRGARAVDVRSAGEFDRGALPQFANVPILNNEHRHQVGLTYKQEGQERAIALGMDLVLPLRAGLVQQWREALANDDADRRLLICWRGGLRSRMAAQWLAESGFAGIRVTGGYKALRGEIRQTLLTPPKFLVLTGLTGVGKTELLQELPRSFVVDLEGYANHRGSSFGLALRSVQPAQQTFENTLGFALFESVPEMVIESESRMVGNCVVPPAVKAAMDIGPRVLLECTQEERVARLFAEYVRAPLSVHGSAAVHDHLSSALSRISRRLGGQRFLEIRRLLDGAFFHRELKLERHVPWIEALLREYYDPLYEHSLRSYGEKVVFRGDFAAVREFLLSRASSL